MGERGLPFIVRPMEERDIPAVMAIERVSFPAPWPESAYHYELRHGRGSRFYVLQAAGLALAHGSEGAVPPVLGYAGLRFRGNEAHLSTLAIHPEWRGLGLGKFLLLTVLRDALRRGVRRITLEVRPSNRVAQHLYRALGFIFTGVRPAYYRDGEDAWLMALGPLGRADVARLQVMWQEASTHVRKACRGEG